MRKFFLEILLFLSILTTCQGNDIGLPFIQNASSFSAVQRQYDYIIVGGGTAGCPLAATLSQKYRVLVLERGASPYGNQNILRLENFGNTLIDISHQSPSQVFISSEGVLNNRARVLGGGTCINAGFYTRASQSYIIEAAWDRVLVEESYEWVEKQIVHEPVLTPWQEAFRNGLHLAGVLPYNGFTYQDVYGTKVGGTIFDSNGFRSTAADLLKSGNPANLRVLIHATVKRIIFDTNGSGDQPRAIGVIFSDENGTQHQAMLTNTGGDVILSSGALGSPQLLMLSGIGPISELQKLQIPVVLSNEFVGKRMADNPLTTLVIPTNRAIEKSLIQVVDNSLLGVYIEASSGFCRSTSQVLCTQLPNETYRGASVLFKVKGPLSAGSLNLTTRNVIDTPIVSFNYFSNPEDLRKCVDGVRILQRLVRTKPIRDYYSEPIVGLNISDTKGLEQFCKDTVQTIWHYHGGSLVGMVVGSDYQVIGVNGLRVVDGSTFSASPGANPQATVMMLGRYVGVQILKERLDAAAGV